MIFKCGPWSQKAINLAKNTRLGSVLSSSLWKRANCHHDGGFFRNRFMAHQAAVGPTLTRTKVVWDLPSVNDGSLRRGLY